MASAYYHAARAQWFAQFRGLYAKKRTTIKVPSKRANGPTATKEARSFAEEVERYCRLLEGPHDPEDRLHALRLHAITQEQADAIAAGSMVPARHALSPRLTLRAAALMHPSSQRDGLTQQIYYLKTLDDFSACTGCLHVADLTIDHALQWVSLMKRRQWKWDSRRHGLLYLRRAAAMGTTQGIPNRLASFRLDQQERRATTVRTWTLPRLCQALKTTTDPRARGVLVLGGCLGLRPTEICRAHIEDLNDDVLHIGQRCAKTTASVRSLPVPAAVLKELRQACEGRTSGAMIKPIGPRAGAELTLSGLHQLMTDTLIKPTLGPKDLRKTFATWAATVIPSADLERYLGHATLLHAAITARHYLAAHQIEQLRPATQLLNTALRACLVE